MAKIGPGIFCCISAAEAVVEETVLKRPVPNLHQYNCLHLTGTYGFSNGANAALALPPRHVQPVDCGVGVPRGDEGTTAALAALVQLGATAACTGCNTRWQAFCNNS